MPPQTNNPYAEFQQPAATNPYAEFQAPAAPSPVNTALASVPNPNRITKTANPILLSPESPSGLGKAYDFAANAGSTALQDLKNLAVGGAKSGAANALGLIPGADLLPRTVREKVGVTTPLDNIRGIATGVKNLPAEDARRKQAGYGDLYTALAPAGEALGVNVPGMEQSAKEGNVAGVVGHTAAPLAALATSEIAPKVIGKVAPNILPEARANFAKRSITKNIKPTGADLKFGRDPAGAVIREGITGNDLEDLGGKVYDRAKQVGNAINDVLNTPENSVKTVDVTPTLSVLDDEMAAATKAGDKEYFDRLNSLKQQVTQRWAKDPETGSISPVGERNLAKMSPAEATELKRQIGDMTRWTGNDPFENQLNAAKAKMFGGIKDIVNGAVPEVKDLNSRYADLVGAGKSIERRLPVAARNAEFSLGDLGTAAIAHTAGGPAAAAAVAGKKILGSTAFKTRMAQIISPEAGKFSAPQPPPFALSPPPGQVPEGLVRQMPFALEENHPGQQPFARVGGENVPGKDLQLTPPAGQMPADFQRPMPFEGGEAIQAQKTPDILGQGLVSKEPLTLSSPGEMPPDAQRPLPITEPPAVEPRRVYPGQANGASGGPSVPPTEGGNAPKTPSPKGGGGGKSEIAQTAEDFLSQLKKNAAPPDKLPGDFTIDRQAENMALAENAAGKLPKGTSVVQRAQQLKEQLQATQAVTPNASGESGASLEAIRRVASEKAGGSQRYRIDTRSGAKYPLIGPDAVDAKAGPYDVIVSKTPIGDVELDRGARARRYNLK